MAKKQKEPIIVKYIPVPGTYLASEFSGTYLKAYIGCLRAAESEVAIITDNLFSNESHVNLDDPFHRLAEKKVPITIYAGYNIQFWRINKLQNFKNVELCIGDPINSTLVESLDGNYLIVDEKWILSDKFKKSKDFHFKIENNPKKAKKLKLKLEKLIDGLSHQVKIRHVKK